MGLYLHPRDVRCRIPCHIRQITPRFTPTQLDLTEAVWSDLRSGYWPAGVSYNKWGVTRRRAHDGTRGVGHEPPNFTADLFTDASGYGVYDVCTMHGLEILPFK